MKRALILVLLLFHMAAVGQEVTIETIVEGTGPEAKLGDRVAISYVLRLASGEIVDATADNTTFRFELGSKKVIPGMTQAVLGMRRGGSRRAIIPPALAYGPRRAGPIPPDSTLYFEIELSYFDTSTGDVPLSERFGKEGDQNRPDARNLDKPAMFEFLIRDFFTRPWRYGDSPWLISRASGALTLVTILLWVIPSRLRRRRGWSE